jgi:tetratricopeptide (TPR) repeat protein
MAGNQPERPAKGHPRTVPEVPATRSDAGTLQPGATSPAGRGVSADALPEHFGRYRIVKKLGGGGMGDVYLAHDSQLNRDVALKVPRLPPGDPPDFLERFYREARAAATLHHPNICAVFDVGEFNGTPYLTMAYIDGKPLADIVGQGKRLPPQKVAALVRKLAKTLQEAHTRGVVHRDLKPANVMIDARDQPVIMDFGLARLMGPGEARLTQDGMLMGTPAYMAPEQVSGQADLQGPSCDIYTLGVILFELLTGQLPFTGNLQALLTQIVLASPPVPSSLRPGLDPALDAICLKALAKKPEQRYIWMADFAQALEAYLRSEPKPSAPPPLPAAGARKQGPAAYPARTVMEEEPTERLTPTPKGAGRGKLLLLGGAAVAVIALIGAVAFLLRPSAAAVTREGVALLEKGEHGEAIKKFTRALEIDPKFVDAYIHRARAAHEKHDYDHALNDASQAIELDRKAARAYVYRAAAYDELGQCDKSLPDCEEALRLDPKLALAYVYRASALVSLRHDKEAALADCNKALELDPDLALAYLGRTGCRKDGAFSEALADCNLAIQKAPKLAKAYAARGAIRAAMKQPDAFKDFDTAHELDPQDPGIFQGRALYFHQKGDLDQALADVDKAITLAPKLASGYTLRAMIRVKKNDGKDGLDKAIDDAAKATHLNPSSSDAHSAKAMAYVYKGDGDQAFQSSTRALDLNPKAAMAYYFRACARILRSRRDVAEMEKALRDIDECLKLLGPEVTGDIKKEREQIAQLLQKLREGGKGREGE